MFPKKWALTLLISLLFFLPACSIIEDFYPKIDKEEVTKELKGYLKSKYQKEFSITKIRRSCTGFGASCAHQVDADAYAKGEPEIKFSVNYDLETRKSEDAYHAGYWGKQAQDEWNNAVKHSFRVKPGMLEIRVSVNEELVKPDSFPYYREVLGSMIYMVYLDIDVNKCEDTRESWKREAQKLIKLKEHLSADEVTDGEMEYFGVTVDEVKDDDKGYSRSSCYSITLDQVSDVERTMEKIHP
ncbi:hypothetical protein HMPREF9374_3855 [Desmospora sp. 8437]|nr:hypothetical protein HMPREF9374_3855 [Desmospora sp. 8437]